MKRSPEVEARLTALVDRYALPAAASPRFLALLDVLRGPDAPTTVRDPRVAVDVHVGDALVALELPEVRGAALIADLGAGAGLPGLALAVALPDSRVALVESQGRKCAFLRTAADRVGAANVEVVCSRAESWEAGVGRCDVVTARAVAPLAVLCEYAAPLLRLGGVLVAWKGEAASEELADGRAAADVLGLEAANPRPVRPYPESDRRTLHRFRKARDTPSRFPRRPGMAAKRPLRASA